MRAATDAALLSRPGSPVYAGAFSQQAPPPSRPGSPVFARYEPAARAEPAPALAAAARRPSFTTEGSTSIPVPATPLNTPLTPYSAPLAAPASSAAQTSSAAPALPQSQRPGSPSLSPRFAAVSGSPQVALARPAAVRGGDAHPAARAVAFLHSSSHGNGDGDGNEEDEFHSPEGSRVGSPRPAPQSQDRPAAPTPGGQSLSQGYGSYGYGPHTGNGIMMGPQGPLSPLARPRSPPLPVAASFHFGVRPLPSPRAMDASEQQRQQQQLQPQPVNYALTPASYARPSQAAAAAAAGYLTAVREAKTAELQQRDAQASLQADIAAATAAANAARAAATAAAQAAAEEAVLRPQRERAVAELMAQQQAAQEASARGLAA